MSETLKAILETQLVGIIRVGATMPIEHALDRVKTLKQSKLHLTYLQAISEIRSVKGLIGFYDGFQPNFMRAMLKQYYRWPMMVFIPQQLNKKIHNQTLNKTITGISIGLFESCIICPLERLKTLRMTATVDFSYFSLKNKLFTGLKIQSIRQVVSWTSYLYWDHKLRYYLKQNISDSISFVNVLISSVCTSFLNVGVVHPFDTVKTLYQQQNNQHYMDQKLSFVFREVYQLYGLRGLYAGWQARVIAFFCQAMLTTPTIDYLERTYGIAKKK